MSSPKAEKFAKIARIILILYAVSLTAVTALSLTIGPFKGSVPLWFKIRSLEAELSAAQRTLNTQEQERERLLLTVKNLRADWATQQESIRVLREAVKDPQMTRQLLEANRLVDKLNHERAVLLVKLNELRQEMQSLTGGGKGPETKK